MTVLVWQAHLIQSPILLWLLPLSYAPAHPQLTLRVGTPSLTSRLCRLANSCAEEAIWWPVFW